MSSEYFMHFFPTVSCLDLVMKLVRKPCLADTWEIFREMPLWIYITSLAIALYELFSSILWYFQPEHIFFICIWKCHVGLVPMTVLLLNWQETGIVLGFFMAYFVQTCIYYFYYFIIIFFVLKKSYLLSKVVDWKWSCATWKCELGPQTCLEHVFIFHLLFE